MDFEEMEKKIEQAPYDTPQVEPGSREKLLDRVAWAAYNNDRVYQGCTRSVLYALQAHLHLGDGEVIKAGTALAGGVARMGETCGALTGGIMAIGLTYGSEKLEDIQSYRETMEACYGMYNQFKSQIGGTMCTDIQERLFGRTFDFKREEDGEEWYRAGGPKKCPVVCALAARIAADIIMARKEKRD